MKNGDIAVDDSCADGPSEFAAAGQDLRSELSAIGRLGPLEAIANAGARCDRRLHAATSVKLEPTCSRSYCWRTCADFADLAAYGLYEATQFLQASRPLVGHARPRSPNQIERDPARFLLGDRLQPPTNRYQAECRGMSHHRLVARPLGAAWRSRGVVALCRALPGLRRAAASQRAGAALHRDAENHLSKTLPRSWIGNWWSRRRPRPPSWTRRASPCTHPIHARLLCRCVAWTDNAPLMVQTLLIESFESTRSIIAVGREAVGLRPDYVLHTDLREFDATYDDGSPNRDLGAHQRQARPDARATHCIVCDLRTPRSLRRHEAARYRRSIRRGAGAYAEADRAVRARRAERLTICYRTGFFERRGLPETADSVSTSLTLAVLGFPARCGKADGIGP